MTQVGKLFIKLKSTICSSYDQGYKTRENHDNLAKKQKNPKPTCVSANPTNNDRYILVRDCHGRDHIW